MVIFAKDFTLYIMNIRHDSQNDEFKLLNIDAVVDMLDKYQLSVAGLVVRDGLAVNKNLSREIVNPAILRQLITPFRTNDVRLLRFLTGNAIMEINFQEYHLSAGDVVLVGPESYYELRTISDDARGQMIAFEPSLYASELHVFTNSPIIIQPEPLYWEEIGRMIDLIYSIASVEPYRKEVLEPMMLALINSIIACAGSVPKAKTSSAAERLFKRFLSELNDASLIKRPLSHYADKLCVTPQYLSRAVSEVSGEPAGNWINKAVLTRARILLEDKSLSVMEIAEELNFPSDSFFCRFFKRETGMTPTAYRNRRRSL